MDKGLYQLDRDYLNLKGSC